jgi:uroporphyrinogen III methyltransferase/synthase
MTDPFSRKNTGKVFLVGAGPGDAGLITVRGVECLKKADLVLFDYLVNPQLLHYAPCNSEKISLGHHHSGREYAQEYIQERMVAAAKSGKIVVRLKGGDPMIFGRAAEEISALAAENVPYEIVPGVTSALAASGYAEIPVTFGDRASAVAFVTGHQRAGKNAEPLDYAALADFPGTLVFYMGVHSARHWSEALLSRGKLTETPVAIVRRASWPDQEVIRCTLGEVAEMLESRSIRRPAVIVVGEVVDYAPAVSWFCSRPLFGKTVLSTRPEGGREQQDELAERLRDLGAEVLFQPAIRISDPLDWRGVDNAIARLREFDWIVFSSVNGVHYFFDRLFYNGFDVRSLGDVKIAAIGPATAEAVQRFSLRADRVPAEFRAEALADSLAADSAGKRFLLIRASRGREALAARLAAAGASVEQVVAYLSEDVEQPEDAIAARLASDTIDWVTVTSSSIARSLVKLFGETLRRAKLASISPVTTSVLEELGFKPAAEAQEYTATGLTEAICREKP